MKIFTRFSSVHTKKAAKVLDSKAIDKAARLSIEDQRKMSERAAKLRAQTATR